MKSSPAPSLPILYMLATPIGNLQDISLRGVQLLTAATVIAAEDTRVARRLLAGLKIPLAARLLSARAHNEQHAAQQILQELQAGNAVVYISDAGTPAVSDPGARIVATVRAAGFEVSPVPGASALTALLAVAALPLGSVHFYGFPPATATARRRLFATVAALDGFSVFYESPHRIAAMLNDLAETLGKERRIVLGRELTKLHEQIIDAPLMDVIAAVAQGEIPQRGEFVFAVENPALQAQTVDAKRIFLQLTAWLPPRKAAAATAKITGANASELYKEHIADKSQ